MWRNRRGASFLRVEIRERWRGSRTKRLQSQHECGNREGLTEIQEEVLGVALLRANVVWTLERVSDEKDGPVEADKIVVAFLRWVSWLLEY